MQALIGSTSAIPFIPLSLKADTAKAADTTAATDKAANITLNFIGGGDPKAALGLLGGGTDAGAAATGAQPFSLLGIGQDAAAAAAPQASLLGLAAAPQAAAATQASPLSLAVAPQAAVASPMANVFAAPTVGIPQQQFGQMNPMMANPMMNQNPMMNSGFGGAGIGGAGMNAGLANPAMMSGPQQPLSQNLTPNGTQQKGGSGIEELAPVLLALAKKQQNKSDNGLGSLITAVISMISNKDATPESLDGTESMEDPNAENTPQDSADDQAQDVAE